MISVLALTSVAGCSLALSGPDSNRPKNRSPECDTGKGLVGLDGVVGSVFATSALVALTEDEQGIAAVTGLLAAAYIGAAIKGNTSVNECRSALAAYNTRTYDPGPEEPEVATTRPRQPSRPAEPRPAPLPPEYTQPQSPSARPPVAPPTVTPPAVAPPVAVAPPPTPVKTPPPWKDPKAARPAPAAEAPVDWRDFWTEVP